LAQEASGGIRIRKLELEIMENDKQPWLFPEMEGFGIKPEVSNFSLKIDKETWNFLQKWKVRVTLNGIIIDNPHSIVADREPEQIEFSNGAVSAVSVKKVDENTVSIDLSFKDGRLSHDKLVLQKNGQVKYIWGKNIEYPKK
jgi:uncharacterized protein YkvS